MFDIAAIRERLGLPESFSKGYRARQFTGQRLKFYEDYLDTGVEMRPYCVKRAEQLEGRGNPLHVAVREIATRLAQGHTVASALAPFVPPTDIVLLTAHERRGTLNDGMAQLIESVRAETALKEEARRELIGPLGYVAAALGIVTYAVPWMVNTMGTGIINAATETIDQRVLLAFGSFMGQASAVFNVLYVLLPVAFVISLPVWTGRARRWADRHLPPYAVYRTFHAALFLRALGAQIAVTPKLEAALGEIRRNSNRWLSHYIDLMFERLPAHRRHPIQALDVGLLDPEMIDSLDIVSTKGSSEQAIAKRAQTAFGSALRVIRRYIAAIKLTGIYLLGAILMWTALSLMLRPVQQQMQTMMNPTAAMQQTH